MWRHGKEKGQPQQKMQQPDSESCLPPVLLGRAEWLGIAVALHSMGVLKSNLPFRQHRYWTLEASLGTAALGSLQMSGE